MARSSRTVPSPMQMQVLLLIGDKRSGRELAELYRREWGESIPDGTLYTTLRRLKEAGWVNAVDTRNTDGRVRLFQLSARGLKALNLGREQLRRIVDFKPSSGTSRRTASAQRTRRR